MTQPVYLVAADRPQRQNSLGRGLVTGSAVGAIGVLLYLLIKNLGFGPGERGAGEPGRGGSQGVPSSPLPLAKDTQRLSFVMTQPTADDPSRPMSFRGPDGKIYALEEMIARVKAGARSDVTLKTAGNVREGSAVVARAAIKQAGIEIWTGGARVSGNARGQYGADAQPSWSRA